MGAATWCSASAGLKTATIQLLYDSCSVYQNFILLNYSHPLAPGRGETFTETRCKTASRAAGAARVLLRARRRAAPLELKLRANVRFSSF